MLDFDFNDEEFVDYYINFLKSISLKFVNIPIELFYNKVIIQLYPILKVLKK